MPRGLSRMRLFEPPSVSESVAILASASHKNIHTDTNRQSPEEDGFARVGLINGEQLVDLLTEHWQDIPDEFRDTLGLKPILVPA